MSNELCLTESHRLDAPVNPAHRRLRQLGTSAITMSLSHVNKVVSDQQLPPTSTQRVLVNINNLGVFWLLH